MQDVLEPCSQGYKLKQASQEYTVPSWSRARCPDLVKWFPKCTGRFYFPEYTSLHAEADGNAKIVRNTQSWAETWSLDLDYIFYRQAMRVLRTFSWIGTPCSVIQPAWRQVLGLAVAPNEERERVHQSGCMGL